MKKVYSLLLLCFVASIDAAPIRVLQVEGTEYDHWAPHPSVAPGVSVTQESGVVSDKGFSNHATEVLKRIVGKHRDIPASTPNPVTEVKFLHFSNYIYEHIGVGSWTGDPVAVLPSKPSWDIECHAWGTMPQVDVVDALKRMDVRALRDNVIIVIALPDLGMGKNSFLPWAQHIILVGSNTGANETEGYRWPDVSSHVWTSYSAPGVVDAVACMVSLYKDKNQPYTVNTIKNFLTATAFKRVIGKTAKGDDIVTNELRLDAAVEACGKFLSNFPTLPPSTGSTPDTAAFLNEIASLRAQNEALLRERVLPPTPNFSGAKVAAKSLGSFLMTGKTQPKFQVALPGRLVSAVPHLDKTSGTVTLTVP